MLTENRLPQFMRQIVNSQRQNRPSISVKPANSQAGPGRQDHRRHDPPHRAVE
jgi:hypothetical protein